MQKSLYLFAGFVLLLAISPFGTTQTGAPSPPEVMVRFSSRSKAAKPLARAAAEGNLSDSELKSYVDSLGQKVGIPLQLKQFGSGGNVVLAIRQNDLAADLAKRVRTLPSVKSASPAAAQGRNGPGVIVEFAPGSEDSRTLAQAAASGRDISPALRPTVEKLKQESGIPLSAQIKSSSRLELTLDWVALTTDLAKRLSACPDVEYAQPNFTRHTMSGQASERPL